MCTYACSDIDDLITNRSSLPDDTLVATNNTSNSDVVNAPSGKSLFYPELAVF